MSDSDRGGNEQDTFCSLCYEPLPGEDIVKTLNHLQEEHVYDEEFYEFVAGLVVRQFCGKCGTAFWSDVEILTREWFAARPYCTDCRRQNRALKKLLTDQMDTRELASRALYRPEYARNNRSLHTDKQQ